MIALALAWLGTAHAATPDPSVERSATVSLRALAYDRSLKTRSEGVVNLVIVHGPEATAHDRAVAAAFDKLALGTVGGLPLHVTEVAFTDDAALDSALSADSIEALWLGDGLDAVLPDVLATARDLGCTTMSDREADVHAGAALAVVIGADQRPTIFVNTGASRAQGADFATDLLALAKIVDR